MYAIRSYYDSREKTFDPDIPLFHVPGRNVMISGSLDAISKYRNVLIEGGGGMFDATSEQVDFYLAFISLQSGGGTMSLSNGIVPPPLCSEIQAR